MMDTLRQFSQSSEQLIQSTFDWLGDKNRFDIETSIYPQAAAR